MMLKFDNKKLGKINSQSAFSFVELMFSLMMLVIILVGLMYTYVVCFKLNNSSYNLILVNNALQRELESIIDTPFANLDALDGTTFDLEGFASSDAVGFVEVYSVGTPPDAYEDLRFIRLTACWRDGENRVIGEDANLDRTLDLVAEDDGDLVVDSPAELVTMVSMME